MEPASGASTSGPPIPKCPGIGVGVHVTSSSHPNCVLLGRRKISMGKGTSQLPGGHLEFGFFFPKKLGNSVLKETGLHLKNVCYTSVVNSIKLEDYHYITLIMREVEVDTSYPSEPGNLEPQKNEGMDVRIYNHLFLPLACLKTQGYHPFKDCSISHNGTPIDILGCIHTASECWLMYCGPVCLPTC
ncbi:nucleotide triphosphate diphosphatase NUDT15 [Huso huso]|uniref:Nucleotide triphosphate diphosphatase NUDT15 n=1 Tax=Huso huso TaxID=61971 RepID=A0ABR0ZKX3_HUSHU